MLYAETSTAGSMPSSIVGLWTTLPTLAYPANSKDLI